MCSSSDRVSGDDFLPSDGKGWEDDLAAQYEENGVPRPDERPSTVFPEQFAAYCEHFVDFFPRSPYFVRTTYDGGSRYGGWPEKKSKKTGRPLPLVDSGKWLNKTDCVERHLDYEQWLLFKQTTEPSEGHERFGDYYWLGMTRPKKTKFHSIDFDNKRILGYYGKPVLPVVHMPLDHFKAMKRIYEEFPHRIWCITSETLGLDIIERHKLLDSDEIHDRVKRRLSQIGLGNTEVHPMRGRCKRRPFGTHYRTITADGVLGIDQMCKTPRRAGDTRSGYYRTQESLVVDASGFLPAFTFGREVATYNPADNLSLADLEQNITSFHPYRRT